MENPNYNDNHRTDVEKFRCLAAISYLFYPVALLMLVLDSKSNYVRYHLNQVVLLLLWNFACSFVMIIPLLGWIVGVAGGIAGLVFSIIAAVKALRREYYEIPLIGKYRVVPEV